jgi:hypothetical protein
MIVTFDHMVWSVIWQSCAQPFKFLIEGTSVRHATQFKDCQDFKRWIEIACQVRVLVVQITFNWVNDGFFEPVLQGHCMLESCGNSEALKDSFLRPIVPWSG